MYNKLFNKFCKERNVSDSTRTGYWSAIKKYENYHKQTMEELLKEALSEEESNVPLKERKIKQRLISYRTFLLNSNLSQNTVRSYFTKIKTFYEHFEIEIPHLPQAKYAREYETNYLDLPSKEHIRMALDISTLDLKAVILFMASSGTAKAETLSLSVKDFILATRDYHTNGSLNEILNQLNKKENIIPTFYLKRIKTDKWYYTFCSSEATKYNSEVSLNKTKLENVR